MLASTPPPPPGPKKKTARSPGPPGPGMAAWAMRMFDEGGWDCQPAGRSKSIDPSPCGCEPEDPCAITSPREEIGPTELSPVLCADSMALVSAVGASVALGGGALWSPWQEPRLSRSMGRSRVSRFISFSPKEMAGRTAGREEYHCPRRTRLR